MKKYLILLLMMICLIGFVSADLGTFKQGDCVRIKTILNTTSANISTISYPNATIDVTNRPMTQAGKTFYYDYCNTSVLGTYIYDYFDISGNVYVNSFDITYTGEQFEISEVYVYIIALIFLVLLIFGTVYVIGKLPGENTKDQEGVIIQVSQLKHLRKVLWAVVWILSIAIIFIISNVGIAYLPNTMIGDLFFNIYTIMFWMTIFLLPMWFVYIIWKMWKDKEFQNMIERGVDMGDI